MIPPIPYSGSTLVLRRVFRASRERVFRAWIEPEALEIWMRPGGMSMTVRSLEAHAGGSFCFSLENGTSIVGTYLRIIPPGQLVFTWSGELMQNRETIVTLDFLDQGPMTEVVLTHEGLSTPDLRAMVEGGWPTLLKRLAELLSS